MFIQHKTNFNSNQKLILTEISNTNWNVPAFATCLAISYLNKCLSSQKHQWELAAKKSEKWFEKNFPSNRDVMAEKAEQFI